MNVKNEIILTYKELTEKSTEDAIKEIKDVLNEKEDHQVVIDFQNIGFKKEELEDIFDFMIKYKKNKIILLRNITDENYLLIKYWQDLNTIKNEIKS